MPPNVFSTIAAERRIYSPHENIAIEFTRFLGFAKSFSCEILLNSSRERRSSNKNSRSKADKTASIKRAADLDQPPNFSTQNLYHELSLSVFTLFLVHSKAVIAALPVDAAAYAALDPNLGAFRRDAAIGCQYPDRARAVVNFV